MPLLGLGDRPQLGSPHEYTLAVASFSAAWRCNVRVNIMVMLVNAGPRRVNLFFVGRCIFLPMSGNSPAMIETPGCAAARPMAALLATPHVWRRRRSH